jgi:hypothetical protein
MVEHSGHVWIQLEMPSYETDGTVIVASLVAQAREIERVAYGEGQAVV